MKILVIGDSCRDIFQYGKCDRLSPEAPVPVFAPTYSTENGGMSTNVANNIKSLFAECDLITNPFPSTKTRMIDHVSNQMLLRVDDSNCQGTDPMTLEQLDKICFENYDAVVISDYNKGFLTEQTIEIISKRHPLTFMDSKRKLGNWASNIEFIKINDNEFQENYKWLCEEYKYQLITTQGKEGAILNMKDRFSIDDEHHIMDLSGAGDSFLAGLVVSFVRNRDVPKAITFANKCASWVVTQKGVVTINFP